MKVKKWISFITIIVCAQCLHSQSLKVIQPEISGSNNYSKKEQQLWEKYLSLYNRINEGDVSYSQLTAYDQQFIDSLEMGFGPMTQGADCSWYCGGGPYKITSSGNLAASGNYTYGPDNLHDFNLFTAWAPDTKSGVKGRKMNFYFKPFTPRITTIIIYNGYTKNRELWQQNARARRIKLYINNKPYAILELKDTPDQQSFTIEPVQSTTENEDLVLTLEIMDFYKGTTFKDLAISEINFDGLDVH